MSYVGRQPSEAILTNDDIADGTVTKDKVSLISNGTAGVTVKGDGGSNDAYIAMNCRDNSHAIKLKAPPHSAGQSYTLTFPSTAPVNGKVLQTDGSGNLSFADGNLAASCSFAAYIGSSQTNMPVNTLTTFPFNTEFFDLGSNFDTSSYTFTAPATGYYQFNTYIRLNNNNRDMSYIQFRLSTTTQTYERAIWDPNAFYNDVTYWNMFSTDLVFMNSGNTAKPQWYQGNGSANVDIPSGANQSMFSGMRVA